LTTLDKAKVEAAVLLAERWLIAVLRHEKFFSLADLNQAIATLLERLNQRPFRKREETRASLYAALDRPALQPLPGERYLMADWDRLPRRGPPFQGLSPLYSSAM
jgi:hypothetical protein